MFPYFLKKHIISLGINTSMFTGVFFQDFLNHSQILDRLMLCSSPLMLKYVYQSINRVIICSSFHFQRNELKYLYKNKFVISIMMCTLLCWKECTIYKKYLYLIISNFLIALSKYPLILFTSSDKIQHHLALKFITK